MFKSRSHATDFSSESENKPPVLEIWKIAYIRHKTFCGLCGGNVILKQSQHCKSNRLLVERLENSNGYCSLSVICVEVSWMCSTMNKA